MIELVRRSPQPKGATVAHIYCAPHHPQTKGKIEPCYETLKVRIGRCPVFIKNRTTSEAQPGGGPGD
jgi:hypothetical protein